MIEPVWGAVVEQLPFPDINYKGRAMNAVVYTEYGSPDVLHVEDVAQPTPQANEIRVRVHATTINYGDLVARNFRNVRPRQFNMPFLFWILARFDFGFRTPNKRILGSEFSGEVDAVGEDVTRFQPGDPVFGYLGQDMGAYAEYICMAEDGKVAPKPANVTYEEAATIPYGALTALNLLRKVDVQPGQRVLINGASGGIGSAAVQLAKHFGANVTGVCSTRRMAYVQSLGADRVIDYTQEDFTQNGELYDLIFDILGRSSFAQCKGSLTPNGRYLLASFKTKQLAQMLWTSFFSSKRVVCALSMESRDDLELIQELVESGQIKPVVDRCFPLAEAAAAHRYVEDGLKQGPVVLTM